MGKALTKAQLMILRDHPAISVSRSTGSVWSSDGSFTVKVRRPTFDALVAAGMYLPSAQNEQTVVYSRTIAGRACLDRKENQS